MNSTSTRREPFAVRSFTYPIFRKHSTGKIDLPCWCGVGEGLGFVAFSGTRSSMDVSQPPRHINDLECWAALRRAMRHGSELHWKNERVTVRILWWQRETKRYSSSRYKPSSKYNTRDKRGGMQREAVSLPQKFPYPFDALRPNLSTRLSVLHPDGTPFQVYQFVKFARTKKPRTVECSVRTLFNRWLCAARLHLANDLGCINGCGGASDCDVHYWSHCTSSRGALELALLGGTCPFRRAAVTYTA